MKAWVKYFLIGTIVLTLLVGLSISAFFLILNYGKTTNAFLAYDEIEITYDMIERIEKDGGYHDLGSYRHGWRSRDYYYSINGVFSEKAIVVKKVRKGKESYALLYDPDTVSNPYALFAPQTAKLIPDDSPKRDSKVSFVISDDTIISSLWQSFLDAEAQEKNATLQAVSLGSDNTQKVSLLVGPVEFTLCDANGNLVWCAYNWNATKCWLIPYDENTFEGYLLLYEKLSAYTE